MARTNATLVRGVLLGSYDAAGAPDLTPFIDTASAYVDAAAACAVRKARPLADATLELMERWLAAHFYLQGDPQLKSTRTLSSAAEFRETDYLGAALGLDPTGCLSAAVSRRTASLSWGGKPSSTERDYRERNG